MSEWCLRVKSAHIWGQRVQIVRPYTANAYYVYLAASIDGYAAFPEACHELCVTTDVECISVYVHAKFLSFLLFLLS